VDVAVAVAVGVDVAVAVGVSTGVAVAVAVAVGVSIGVAVGVEVAVAVAVGVDVAVAVAVGVGELAPDENERLTSSIPVNGRFPEPVVAAFVTMRIQTGPELLSRAAPKLTVTLVVPHALPNDVVRVAGDVVAFVKDVGVAPNP